MRSPSRPHARAALLALATVALGMPLQALAPGSDSHDAQVLFARWMRLDALSAEDAAAAAVELARRREWLLVAFAHAAEQGPPDDELARALSHAAPAAARAAGAAVLRRVADEIARRQQVERVVRQYRARALLGLALLGDAGALARIARHAEDRDDPLAPEARAALRVVQAN